MTSRVRVRRGVLMAVALAVPLITIYSPALLALVFQAGWLANPAVGGYVLQMKSGWVPIVADENGNRKWILLGSSDKGKVMFVRQSIMRPFSPDYLTIWPAATLPSDDPRRTRNLTPFATELGPALVLDPETQRKIFPELEVTARAVLLEAPKLMVIVPRLEMLREIVSVQREGSAHPSR